jgi:capsule biosynthesis phosphatase
MNVIVPLAGTGSRFLKQGYVRPKPFIRANGKEIIIWLLEKLSVTKEDMLILVYSENPEIGMSSKNFFRIIDDFYANAEADATPKVQLVSLDEPTVGAAETVLRGIEHLPNARLDFPSVLLDGDTFYSRDILSDYRKYLASVRRRSRQAQCGGLVFVFDDDKPDEAPYSYIKVSNETQECFHKPLLRIAAIAEKNKSDMSPLACSGCYCFDSTAVLHSTIARILSLFKEGTLPGREGKLSELYTSAIISNALSEGHIFWALRLDRDDFTVLGTPEQLSNFMKTVKSVFKRFCFDLDNTLVTPPRTPGDYSTCEPIKNMIAYVRKLYAEGHFIIIHTARRMRTHRGNVGAVVADVGLQTLVQLQRFDVPYHELIFGKPYADFYIDDKAVIALVDDITKETGVC